MTSNHFLVQWPIGQFEILHTVIDIAVLPGPILSSADVVQYIIDLVVVKHLPRVVLDDSVLCVSHTITYLASIHLLLLPLPNVLTDPQELDLLPGKIGITVPSVFLKKSHICFLFELSNFFLRTLSLYASFFLPKH